MGFEMDLKEGRSDQSQMRLGIVGGEDCGSDCLLCFSLEAEGGVAYSANLSENEDAISLSDIVPETKICFVSRVACE